MLAKGVLMGAAMKRGKNPFFDAEYVVVAAGGSRLLSPMSNTYSGGIESVVYLLEM